MPTLAERRAETARRNGALSRGPVTAAGKARSARNATRHGLDARSLPEGAAGAIAALRAALLARWQPWDVAEAHQVEEILFAHWRQARLRALEEMVLARLRHGEELAGLPSLATVLRYRARIDRAMARATAELEALQARRDRTIDPARLRWLADQIERGRAAEPDESTKCTNELSPGMNEPTPPHDRPARSRHELAPRTREPGAPRTREPGHAADTRSEKCTNELVAGMNEPSAGPAAVECTNELRGMNEPTGPRPNRHQRRRMAALARRRCAAVGP